MPALSTRERLIVALYCLAAPFAYSWLLDSWRAFADGLNHPLPSPLIVAQLLVILREVSGVLVAAAVLCWPLLVLIRSHTRALVALLVLATSMSIVPQLLMWTQFGGWMLWSDLGFLALFGGACLLIARYMDRRPGEPER